MHSVKRADRPDSVQRPHPLWGVGAVTAIPLGRESPTRLDATYPHTPRTGSTCAYSVLLRVEIARFTLGGFAAQGGCGLPHSAPEWLTAQTRLCCSDPHLTVDSR